MVASKPNHSSGKLNLSQLLLVILVLILLGLGYYVYKFVLPTLNKPTQEIVTTSAPPTPTETPPAPGLVRRPTPYLLLPQGKQTYTIESGAGDEPRGLSIIADPLDSPKGTQQSITLGVEYKSPISSVSVTVYTDNSTTTYPMKLSSGNTTKGDWIATWTMNDTHEKTYSMRFNVKYNDKEKNIDFPIR